MSLIKRLFLAYVATIVIAIAAYGVSRMFTPPRDPDTLFTIYIGSIRSLDPILIADVTTGDIMGHVYETLYTYRYGGKVDELIPQLASDFPKISEDGLTYTIPLRRGVRYYDPKRLVWPGGTGPEVTAQDLIYSWKRMADFHSAAPSYSTVLQDNIVGLDDFRAYTEKADVVDYDRPVAGLTAPDPHTLVVRLTKRIPNFPQLTAYLGVATVSREAVEKLTALGNEGMKGNPIGTGPYAVESYLPEQRLVLVANPVYRGRPDIDPAASASLSPAERQPHIRRVQYDYMPETLPPWYLFLQSRYDLNSPPKETFSSAISDDGQLRPEFAAKKIELNKYTDLGLYYLQFNMTDPAILKNKPLREAVALSIDRKAFIRTYLNGRGLPGTGILPPDAPLYSPEYTSAWTRLDLELARAKVEEAKRVAGGSLPKLRLQMMDTDTEQRQFAEFFCSAFRAVGLDVEPEYNTYARYLEKMDAKEFQIAYGGWFPDYPDEKTYLRLFDATLAAPPGSNSSGYNNPVYQEKLERALVMPRSPERDKLYRELAAIIDDDVPVTATHYPLRYRLSHDWMGGWKAPNFAAGFIANWTLDVQKRREETTPATVSK